MKPNAMPVVWEDENGEEYPHYELAENIKFDNQHASSTKIASEDVQGAIEELASRINESSGSSSTVSSDTIYLIKPGTKVFVDNQGNSIEATLTQGAPIPAYNYYYELDSDNNRVYKYGDTESVGTNLTYESMFQNALYIELSIDEAYRLGYRHIVLQTGDYCFIPQRPVNVIGSQHPCIQILNKEHLDIDLGGSNLYFVVDSEYANPYYEPNRANTSGIAVWACMINFQACRYVSIHDGKLIGDKYTRKFAIEAECDQEQTYGIGTGGFCKNILIKSIECTGFMGDGIGTGRHGATIYLRNKFGNYFKLDANDNYVLNNNGYKQLGGTVLFYNNYPARIRFVYDDEYHNQKCTGAAGPGNNGILPIFEGPGYNQKLWKDRYSYVTLSTYIRVKELRDFGMTTDKYKNYDVIRKTIEERELSIGGDKVGYKHLAAILTYAFDDDKIHFTYNDEEYTYYVGYTAGVGVTIGGVLPGENYKEGGVTYSRLGEIVKEDGTAITIDGTEYNRLDYRVLAANSTYSAVVKNTYRAMIKQALAATTVKPHRTIYLSYDSNFTLLPEETHVRVQFYFDKPAYTNELFSGTAFGEAKLPTDDQKYDFLEHDTLIQLPASTNVVIDNCNVYNNFRGGITCGVDKLIIHNTRFYKDLTPKPDKTNLYVAIVDNENQRLILPGFRDSTDYAIDAEEGGTPFTIIDSCKFERGVSVIQGSEKTINTSVFISGSTIKFQNNHCYSGVSIRFTTQVEVSGNVFYSGGVGLRAYQNTPYIIKNNYQYLGNGYIKPYVNIHDNIFHRHPIPDGLLNNFIINRHNNIYHVKGYDHSDNPKRWNTQEPEWLLNKTKLSSFHDNIVIFYALGAPDTVNPAMPQMVYPIMGSGYNNKFINLGGLTDKVYIAPTAHARDNDVINASIQVGFRPTSNQAGFNTTYQRDTLPIMEGMNFNTDTNIKYWYGDPSVNLSIKNCIFDGLINHDLSYVSYIDRPTNLCYPTVEVASYHKDTHLYDDSSVYRQYYKRLRIVNAFTNDDIKIFVDNVVDMLSRTVHPTITTIPNIVYDINVAPDECTFAPKYELSYILRDIQNNKYSGYKLEILNLIQTYASAAEEQKDNIIEQIKTIIVAQLANTAPIEIYANSTVHFYTWFKYQYDKDKNKTYNNFTSHINVTIDKPELLYSASDEAPYSVPSYNSSVIDVEVMDENYQQAALETINMFEPVTTDNYYLNFKQCLFKRHPNVPIPIVDTDKTITVRFINCDFTELKDDENYLLDVDYIVTNHAQTTGIVNNKLYYATDTEKYYKSVSGQLKELKLVIDLIDCYTNDGFTINKVN